jgi:hypothetical protein
VDVLVAVVETAAVVVVVLSVLMRLVVGGLVVVVPPGLAHPTASSAIATSVKHTHMRFMTLPPEVDASWSFSSARTNRALVLSCYSPFGRGSPA